MQILLQNCVNKESAEASGLVSAKVITNEFICIISHDERKNFGSLNLSECMIAHCKILLLQRKKRNQMQFTLSFLDLKLFQISPLKNIHVKYILLNS